MNQEISRTERSSRRTTAVIPHIPLNTRMATLPVATGNEGLAENLTSFSVCSVLFGVFSARKVISVFEHEPLATAHHLTLSPRAFLQYGKAPVFPE